MTIFSISSVLGVMNQPLVFTKRQLADARLSRNTDPKAGPHHDSVRFSGQSQQPRQQGTLNKMWTLGLMALGVQGASGFKFRPDGSRTTDIAVPGGQSAETPFIDNPGIPQNAHRLPTFLAEPTQSAHPAPPVSLLSNPDDILLLAKSGQVADGTDSIRLITGPGEEKLFYEVRLKNGTSVGLSMPHDPRTHQAFLNALKGDFNITPQKAPMSQSSLLYGIAAGVSEALVITGMIALIRRMAQKNAGNEARRLTHIEVDNQKKQKPTTPVTFKDVRGYPEVIRELKRVKDRYLLGNLGRGDSKIKVKPIKGILLEGPPGTGKSMMAKALATESKVPFHYVSGSQFVEMYVGVGAARVRSLFAQAKKDADKHGGAIIFIDELDSIGGKREHGLGGGSEERTNALNELLQQMSGFNDDPRIMVLAATNRADYLDDALKRSGRFDRTIQVDLPRDKEQRSDILDKYLSEHPTAEKLDRDIMAEFTHGKSGADLANLVNQMAEAAVDRITEAGENPEKKPMLDDPEFHKLNTVDFFNALRNMEMGIPREARGSEDERKTVAVHEVVGHGLVARAAKTPLHIVSMQPRGNALGHVITDPRVSSRMLPTLESMLKDLVISMGGRASEREMLGPERITPGASGDIAQSKAKIRQMLATRMLAEGSGADYDHPSAQLNEQDRKLSDWLLKEAEKTASDVIRRVPRQALDKLVNQALNLTDELEGEQANAFYQEVLETVGQEQLYEPIRQFIEKTAG